MQTAIVTGATGFLGRHLVQELIQHGVNVTALTRRPRHGEWLATSVPMGNAPWSSIRLARTIDAVRPDVIFHLVGGAAGSPAELEALNLRVTEALLRALRLTKMRPLLVCCGSAAEYGAAVVDGAPVEETVVCAPVSPYGAIKLAQTKAVLAFSESTGTPVLVNRIFNMIGPGMPDYLALGEFARQIAQLPASEGALLTGNLRVFRDFIDVCYVASAFRKLALNPAARGIVNVCSGEATELAELVRILIDVSGKDVMIETRPERLRRDELKVVIGSPTLLTELGAARSHVNYADVIARIWQDAETRWAGVA